MTTGVAVNGNYEIARMTNPFAHGQRHGIEPVAAASGAGLKGLEAVSNRIAEGSLSNIRQIAGRLSQAIAGGAEQEQRFYQVGHQSPLACVVKSHNQDYLHDSFSFGASSIEPLDCHWGETCGEQIP